MDTVSPSERSRIMASVKSDRNKSTEIAVAVLLRKYGVSGWRRHYPLEGKPDFVFLKNKIALFIDGCLWHGCPKHCRIPKTNRQYWVNKISKNKARDARMQRKLRTHGWTVIRIWEHEIKTSSVLIKIGEIKKRNQ